MEKSIALGNLCSIRDVLQSLNVRYFLIDGTLLGFYREGDFIGFDSDTDMGVMWEDCTRESISKLIDSLSQQGFVLEHVFGDFDNNYELSFNRFGVKTDLFFYRPLGDKTIFHAFNGEEIITYWYDTELITTLEEVLFLGQKFMAPKDIEKVLLCKYGDTWRIPDKNWDWAYSPKNILNKKPIVFTVGCFDMLHEGHINLFEKMREASGLSSYDSQNFYVFIHDDYTILQNKGRLPVQTLEHRSMNLDILRITHSIEVNHADPTIEIQRFVEGHPNASFIYMRGDDWKDFPGKKYLDSVGIPIVYVPYTKGVSSTLRRETLK